MYNQLDRIDVNILAVLQEDGRIQNQLLAERVGLSPGACSARLKKLERAKLIKSYNAELDLRKICNAVSVQAVVTLAAQGSMRQSRFIQALSKLPEVVDCIEVAGEADFIVSFLCASLEDYHSCVDQLVENDVFGVSKVESHIVLRRVVDLQRSNFRHLASRNGLV